MVLWIPELDTFSYFQSLPTGSSEQLTEDEKMDLKTELIDVYKAGKG